MLYLLVFWGIFAFASSALTNNLNPTNTILLEKTTGGPPTSSGRYIKRPHEGYTSPSNLIQNSQESEVESDSESENKEGQHSNRENDNHKNEEDISDSRIKLIPINEYKTPSRQTLPKALPKTLPVKQIQNTNKAGEANDRFNSPHFSHSPSFPLIQIEVAPGFLYADSSSSYFFKKYSFFSQGGSVASEFFVIPFLSIEGHYMGSLGARLKAVNSYDSFNISYQKWHVSINTHQYKIGQEKTPSLTYGMFFSESQLNVSNDALTRTALKTSGFGLHFRTRLNTSNSNKRWRMGASWAPALVHNEKKGGLDLKSGEKVRSGEIGLHIGQEYQFSHNGFVFWDIKVSNQYNQFSGSPDLLDPQTGVTPKNVSVTETKTFFRFGYHWGQ